MKTACPAVIAAAASALVFFMMGLSPIVATAPGDRLPEVTSAVVPFYPRILQVAHIEGVVQLRISTDGERLSSVEIRSGQPMLAKAAQENVKSWQFAPHAPSTFEATFRYRLLPSRCDQECNCVTSERPSIVLQLPREVEVEASELKICGSDRE